MDGSTFPETRHVAAPLALALTLGAVALPVPAGALGLAILATCRLGVYDAVLVSLANAVRVALYGRAPHVPSARDALTMMGVEIRVLDATYPARLPDAHYRRNGRSAWLAGERNVLVIDARGEAPEHEAQVIAGELAYAVGVMILEGIGLSRARARHHDADAIAGELGRWFLLPDGLLQSLAGPHAGHASTLDLEELASRLAARTHASRADCDRALREFVTHRHGAPS